MQRSLRSLLSVDIADFTGLMSGKAKLLCWKAFSNADSSVNEAFRKLGLVPLEDGTKKALEQYRYVCLLVSQEQPLENLLG